MNVDIIVSFMVFFDNCVMLARQVLQLNYTELCLETVRGSRWEYIPKRLTSMFQLIRKFLIFDLENSK